MFYTTEDLLPKLISSSSCDRTGVLTRYLSFYKLLAGCCYTVSLTNYTSF